MYTVRWYDLESQGAAKVERYETEAEARTMEALAGSLGYVAIVLTPEQSGRMSNHRRYAGLTEGERDE